MTKMNKRKLTGVLLSTVLIMSSCSVLACTASTHNFDSIPVSIVSSWTINQEGYYCLRLDITNNGNKTIRDIQGIFYFTDYGYDDTIASKYSWNLGHTLYLYDSNGKEILRKPKTKIKPGESISLVIHKQDHRKISYEFEVHGYITWVDLIYADNWGTKDIVASEADISSKTPRIDIEPLYITPALKCCNSDKPPLDV